MKLLNYKDVKPETIDEDARGVQIRWIITEDMGARNFVMRHFEISPNGYTPLHTHNWEHEIFIISGTGKVVGDNTEKSFVPGDVIFVPGNELHQFRNTGEESLTMLCLIPSKDKCNL